MWINWIDVIGYNECEFCSNLVQAIIYNFAFNGLVQSFGAKVNKRSKIAMKIIKEMSINNY